MSTHGRLGGTSIAALMGEDTFRKTPWDIYMGLVHGMRSPPNEYMKRGLAMEKTVRERYVAETGAVLEPHPGVVHWDECFAASVDDLRVRLGVPGVVDYKTASARSLRKWAGGMLASYRWQLDLYMAVFDRPEADLFVAFGIDNMDEDTGAWLSFDITETRLFTAIRDLDRESRLVAKGLEFWRTHVTPRIPPVSAVQQNLRSEIMLEGRELTGAELATLDRLGNGDVGTIVERT